MKPDDVHVGAVLINNPHRQVGGVRYAVAHVPFDPMLITRVRWSLYPVSGAGHYLTDELHTAALHWEALFQGGRSAAACIIIVANEDFDPFKPQVGFGPVSAVVGRMIADTRLVPAPGQLAFPGRHTLVNELLALFIPDAPEEDTDDATEARSAVEVQERD